MHSIRLTINGTVRRTEVESRTTLLTALREQFALTGTKRGCEEGECGACAVLLDGVPADSCLILAVEANGRNVVTVEGLGNPVHLSPIQQAFSDQGASQCGFCMPGMLISATALLEENSNPGDAAIREAISANLCRCTGYTRIVEAVRAAAELKRSGKARA